MEFLTDSRIAQLTENLDYEGVKSLYGAAMAEESVLIDSLTSAAKLRFGNGFCLRSDVSNIFTSDLLKVFGILARIAPLKRTKEQRKIRVAIVLELDSRDGYIRYDLSTGKVLSTHYPS